ncbi:MAG TPA: hypothetical protein PLH97_10995 [Verrucomicrobiota bacterium]|nr:hypothetical protein [Bryobacteraceae bacterium]HPU56786.1 hypothetical protein [Verrucomicrobiota bacterium]
MTNGQKYKFYFPAWNACCQANGWHTSDGFATVDESRLSEEGRKVLTFARQRALMRDGVKLLAAQPVKLDDLRHGAHWVALGRDKSSEDLTNAEVDRVVALFQVLTDPDDLGARLKWDAYLRGEDPGEVKRLDWSIRHAAPDAYVRTIAADKFGTRAWEHLNVNQKRQLAITLTERRRAWRSASRTGDRTRRKEPADCPF